MRIGCEAPRRQAQSAQRHESHGFGGFPPPRTVIGDPSRLIRSSRNCLERRTEGREADPSSWPHNDTLRRNPLAHQSPECDQQLPSQCHNHRLACSRSILRALVIPACQRAILLEQEEPPRELDHCSPHPRIAGSRIQEMRASTFRYQADPSWPGDAHETPQHWQDG